MNHIINGVICPAITFLNNNVEIDVELNTLLIRHILVNGAKAIYLFGTTGEGTYISEKLEEKIKFINLAYAITDNIPILVGAFGNEVDNVLNQIEILGKKYDTLNFFIAPPFSTKLPKEELGLYFENILGSVSINNNIYLYHNPYEFTENEIDPEIVNDLLKFPNLKGIKDASNKIYNYKAYVQLLGEEFSVFCGEESRFSFFLQLIPPELRKYSGLVPSISNLVNICSKLYKAAQEEDILQLHQLQEQLDDIRNKIYDTKLTLGKIQRGLKHAFLHLYKDTLKISIEDFNLVSPPLQRELDNTTKTRIEAITNSLLNQKDIFQLYSLSKDEIYDLKDIISLFSKVEVLTKQGKIKKVKGPFDGKTNTTYRVNFEDSQVIFRFRTDKSFPYENIVKEKILFPFLDGTLYSKSSKLSDKIKEIVRTKSGAYVFDKFTPPIIPVANLIYFDETKNLIPYIFSVQQYIHGKSLHNILVQNVVEDFNLELGTFKFYNLFREIGELLGKTHNSIKFDCFYENINEIGTKNDKTWGEIFKRKLDKEIQAAKKNKMKNVNEISEFFKDYEALIEEENDPVLLHNDFHSKNIIVREKANSLIISGIIDFDDWGVGVRAQDFVKIKNWDLDFLNQPNLTEAFYEGYMKYFNIDKDFLRKIEIYSLFSHLKLTNHDMTLKRKSERKKYFLDDFLEKYT